ncbi:hypothetical protein FRC03_011200 [Tulasnella sp. 419]|nr:hypothetical protein FRC02_010490 [Tulasnella sp. 418]KAG8955497.1 hypothetical protein FRC03_011200 [Tulasnella sp. 419]
MDNLPSGSRLPQPFPSAAMSDRRREEELVYMFEAEEERITNQLSRKLEKLREENISLENALEAESESHVNRLSKELSALRMLQQQQQNSSGEPSLTSGHANENGLSGVNGYIAPDPRFPPQDVMLEAMRRENEALRNRLVDTERGYIRVTRLNDIYREELIELRRRLGMPIDNLIGLQSSSSDIYTQPTHLRSSTGASSNTGAAHQSHTHRPPLSGLPIPISRAPSSQLHRTQHQVTDSSSTTPNTTSPIDSVPASPFLFSPSTSIRHAPVTGTPSTESSLPTSAGVSLDHDPSSYVTQLTTPPSSTSPLTHLHHGAAYVAQLSYPSVPPPSLSSSLGSPVHSRRTSFGHHGAGPGGRRMSLERGTARVAESGSLRGRRSSTTGGGMPLLPDAVAESPDGSEPSSMVGA